MKVKVSKDLVNGMGIRDFTKGKEYEVVSQGYSTEVNERTMVHNDLEQPHVLGLWHKHFKKVK